ncbi:hypothetical protein ECC02_004317 [Trypanosoma cruzi]|uniref:Uncharacterized protein n=1 Tax=Trypanosoma cruzi TaxID=5693 RepID=A0A7J6Y7H9_TRYCR|nr:hypothetical protein ECC02_004317 [Trypanosoma cruzi]
MGDAAVPCVPSVSCVPCVSASLSCCPASPSSDGRSSELDPGSFSDAEFPALVPGKLWVPLGSGALPPAGGGNDDDNTSFAFVSFACGVTGVTGGLLGVLSVPSASCLATFPPAPPKLPPLELSSVPGIPSGFSEAFSGAPVPEDSLEFKLPPCDASSFPSGASACKTVMGNADQKGSFGAVLSHPLGTREQFVPNTPEVMQSPTALLSMSLA